MNTVKTATAARLVAALSLLPLASCGAIADQLAERAGMSGAARKMTVAAARAAPKVVATQLPVGEKEERAMGGAIAVMIVQRYGGLVEDPALTRYVGKVGNAVAMVSSRPTLKWHFGVLASDQVNAVSAPGGYVFVTRGALAKMRSEAELAGVLAHEVAHITEKHAVAILKRLKGAQAASSSVKSTLGPRGGKLFAAIIDKFVEDYLTKGLPKETEYDADRVAVGLLAGIGYRTTGLRSFLGTMAKPSGSKDAFYDTHPDTNDRLRRLDQVIAASGGVRGVALEARFLKHTGRAAEPAQPAAATGGTARTATRPAGTTASTPVGRKRPNK